MSQYDNRGCAADAMDMAFSHGFDAGYAYALASLRNERPTGEDK